MKPRLFTIPSSEGLLSLAVLVLASLALTSCATMSPDGGLASVKSATRQRLGQDIQLLKTDADSQALESRLDELLQTPLSADNAVQIALLNNRGLQATLYDVGISEADLVQATRLPNPRFSMLYARNGDEFKIEQIATFNIFSLFTMPLARQIGERRLEQTKQLVTLSVLRLAADTRQAYFSAIAAEQAVSYMQQVKLAAEASAELASKMTQAGNFSKRDQAREQVFYAEVIANHARSTQAAMAAREQLTQLLGLSGKDTAFQLPPRLPELPTQITDQPDIEAQAMAQRLDIQAMQLQMQGLAKSLGLTRATRFINVLEIGPARVLEGTRSQPYKKGVDISVELPIFDFGTARVARAEATYMQALNLAAEQAVNARSEVRLAYHHYRSNYDLARHYRDELIPLRKRIAEENSLRYNGMLMSVFELLADAQTQIATTNSYIQALRDFWLAQSVLDMAMAGKPIAASAQ